MCVIPEKTTTVFFPVPQAVMVDSSCLPAAARPPPQLLIFPQIRPEGVSPKRLPLLRDFISNHKRPLCLQKPSSFSTPTTCLLSNLFHKRPTDILLSCVRACAVLWLGHLRSRRETQNNTLEGVKEVHVQLKTPANLASSRCQRDQCQRL